MPPKSSNLPGLLPTWLQTRLEEYAHIFQVVRLAGYYYLRQLWANLRQGRLSVLFGQYNHAVKDRAFAEFYESVSQGFTAHESTTVVPSLVAAAHGVVLDLGPGSGNQLARFDASKVDHVYGVEPNKAFAAAFAERLRGTKIGVDGKYTLVPCAIEDAAVLEKFRLVEGSVDCVLSMQVMCSLPDLEEQVRHMHRLLKPGGELIFWEHCRSTDFVTRAAQWVCCLLWPSIVGGCRLDRVTKEAVLGAAEWEVADFQMESEAHMMMPRISGRLVKPRAA